MSSYVLDPFRFALKAVSRIGRASKAAPAPRVAHAPHAASAEGVCLTVEDRYRRAHDPCSCRLPAKSV